MQIFISHIHQEAPLAMIFKEWIESTFNERCNVFVSSDRRDLLPGNRWLELIKAALESSRLLLILCSSSSIHRPWINFEAGSGWINDVPILPICHSGLRWTELPSPLFTFQGLNLDDDQFVPDFFFSLCRFLDIEPVEIEYSSEMVYRAREVAKAIRVAALKEETRTEASPTTGDETYRAILKTVADGGDEGVTVDVVALSLRLSEAKVKHFLDTLEAAGYVYSTYNIHYPTTWHVTTSGRAYLADWALL